MVLVQIKETVAAVEVQVIMVVEVVVEILVTCTGGGSGGGGSGIIIGSWSNTVSNGGQNGTSGGRCYR